MSFTEVFGGDNVSPAQLSFAAFSSATSLTLVWPFEALDGDNVLAAKINVAMQAASLSVNFPDATLASVGQDALVKNTGAHTFSVKDAAGNTIGAVASGEAWFFYLTGNTSVAGTWNSFQLGTGTSSASAASLAGAGLEAAVTLLNQDLPVSPLPGNYSPGSGNRATVLRGTGGVVTYTPAAASVLGDGWFVYVVNAGSGTLTWDPDSAETIDGSATKVFQPQESAIVFCDGANFWTVGYGRSIVSTVTGVSISAAGTGTMSLSAGSVAAQVQNYTGALTGNRIVEYGTGVGYWFVFNNTSGAFSLTLRVNGADAGAVVSQGSYSIVRSDGTNLDVAFTATSGTVTSVDGTADFTGVPITTTGTIALSTTGVAAGSYGSASKTLVATVSDKGRVTALTAPDIAITASQITDLGSILFPGMIVPTGRSTAPTGWLICDGTSYTTAAQPALFSAIGYAYGGSGANFNVPDLRGRVPAGVDPTGTRLTATTMTPNGTTLGATGGAQTNTAGISIAVGGTASGTVPSLPVAGTNLGDYSLTTAVSAGASSQQLVIHGATSTISGSTGATGISLGVAGTAAGTSSAFGVVQPTQLVLYVIKT